MKGRRLFLKTAALAGAATALGFGPANALRLEDTPLPGIVHTAHSPGPWVDQIPIHVPSISIKDGVVHLRTNHPMSPDHYIVRHTLVAKDGTVVGARTFAPDDEPASSFKLPARGRYYATSFCNMHDLWVSEFLA